MRTSLLMVVPIILLGGLLFGSFKLHELTPDQKTCPLGLCPLSIHESDSGRTFTYSVGARFDVFLAAVLAPSYSECTRTLHGSQTNRSEAMSAGETGQVTHDAAEVYEAFFVPALGCEASTDYALPDATRFRVPPELGEEEEEHRAIDYERLRLNSQTWHNLRACPPHRPRVYSE